MVQYCLTSTETIRLIGRPPHFHTAPELAPLLSSSSKWALVADGDIGNTRLQALVYDILPSTIAVFSYPIGSRKLSANEQFFVGTQTVVSLLQTTHIKQCVSFIDANKVYTSTNKPQ